jgi:preprotein translocase subunit SecD
MGGKYVLGNAVFEGKEITGVAVGLKQNSRQWVVGLTLNAKAAVALGTLTTNQYNTYFPGYQSGDQNDAVLNQAAVVLDGNVQSAPETIGALTTGQFQIAGPQPAGFTEAQAKALAAQL